jgi:hypothetical protein
MLIRYCRKKSSFLSDMSYVRPLFFLLLLYVMSHENFYISSITGPIYIVQKIFASRKFPPKGFQGSYEPIRPSPLTPFCIGYFLGVGGHLWKISKIDKYRVSIYWPLICKAHAPPPTHHDLYCISELRIRIRIDLCCGSGFRCKKLHLSFEKKKKYFNSCKNAHFDIFLSWKEFF